MIMASSETSRPAKPQTGASVGRSAVAKLQTFLEFGKYFLIFLYSRNAADGENRGGAHKISQNTSRVDGFFAFFGRCEAGR